MTTTKASTRRPRSRVLGVCAAVGVAALAFAPLAACAKSGTDAGTTGTPTSTGPSASDLNAGGSGTGGLGGLDGGPGGQPNGGATASPTRSRTTSPKPSAQIVSFKITHQPACPVVGTPDAPFSAPGQDITIEWRVSGAKSVALSVDNPGYFQANHTGSYQTYDGTQGSATISFPCDTNQATTTHTYTINTIGGGTSKSKTLTVTKQSNP